MLSDKNYFNHDADIGIIGRGQSLEESFEQAAQATFALMGNLIEIQPKKTVSFNFDEPDIELAFVTWLNLLIGKAQADDLIFSRFKLKKNGSRWEAQAEGEQWRDEIERGIDVKGATLTMLSVKKMKNYWRAMCVVDV